MAGHLPPWAFDRGVYSRLGKYGLRGVSSAPEEVQSASSPAGVSVEFSLLAGPVGKTGDQIIFNRSQGMKARQSACLFP